MALSSEKTFAEATCVKAVSSHTYSAEFPNDWCIGSGMKLFYRLSVRLE
jgi:hypothetical protein